MKERVDEHHAAQVVVGIDGLNSSLVGRCATGVPSGVQMTSCSVGPAEGAANGQPVGTDPLAALGPILATVAQRDRESAELATERAEIAQKFLDEFAMRCVNEVRPAMRAVLQRLQQLGGDGLIEEHPGGEARFQKPRIALWMSLKDQISRRTTPGPLPLSAPGGRCLEPDSPSRRGQHVARSRWQLQRSGWHMGTNRAHV